MMPRPDGRAARRAATDHLRARLHRAWPRARCSCRSAARGCCAPRRSTRTCPAGCAASGKGWVTAEYSMLPGSSPERIRPRGGKGQAVGAHAGDPAAHRPLAARGVRHGRCSASGRSSSTATCSRPTAARARRRSAAATSRCTTRSRRLVQTGRSAQHPLAERVRGDLGRHRRRRCRCSTSPTSRTRRAEVDMNVVMTGVGPLRRGAGHRRGHAVHPQRARRPARPRPRRASPRSSRCRTSCSPMPPRAAVARRRCSSSSPRPTPTRSRRSSRSLGAARLELLPRPADVPDVVEDGRHARGQRPAQGGRDRATPPGMPALADDTGLEVDASAARPACTRPATRATTRPTPTTSRCCSRRSRASRPSSGPRASARSRWCAGPTGARWSPKASSRATSRSSRAASDGFGYDPVFVPDEGDGRTFAEMAPTRSTSCRIAAARSGRSPPSSTSR